MRRLSFVFISILAASSLAACKKPSPTETKGQGEAPAIKLAPEDIVTVQRGELQTGPRISGALEASQRSVVRAETGGTVLQIGPEHILHWEKVIFPQFFQAQSAERICTTKNKFSKVVSVVYRCEQHLSYSPINKWMPYKIFCKNLTYL